MADSLIFSGMVAPTAQRQSSGTRPHYANAYSHAQAMQAILMQDILDLDTPKALRPRLVEAWDKLEDRKRILRNKPLPGSLQHEKLRERKQRNLTATSVLASMASAQAASADAPSEHSSPTQGS